MFATQTNNLPADQQKRLHPDFLANEEAYLKLRDCLLEPYRGKWVAIQKGQVIAADTNLLAVTESAAAAGGHPYIALVGSEDAVVFRIRSVAFSYDTTYQPFPLPRMSVTFRNHAETHTQTFPDVIPDTGADVSVLPVGDCAAIDLFNSPYFTGLSSGVLGGAVTTLIYRAKADIGARSFAALIQPASANTERILGREVLNEQRVLFDGPAGQVVVDP